MRLLSRRCLLRLLPLCALAGAEFALPSHATAACTTGSAIAGTYGVLVTGTNASGNGKLVSGKLIFDGACGITGQVTTGEPNSAQQVGASVTGTYQQNADKTVSMSLTIPSVAAPETYNVGLSTLFGEALGEENDSSAIATIDLKPMTFPKPTTVRSWDIYAIAGTYTASCYGTGGFSDLNYFTIAPPPAGGNSTMTGIDDTNNGGQHYNLPSTGVVGIHFDGRIYGYVTVAGTIYGFTGVADNNANELQYVYTANVTGAPTIAYCTAKRVAAAGTAAAAAAAVKQ